MSVCVSLYADPYLRRKIRILDYEKEEGEQVVIRSLENELRLQVAVAQAAS